MSDIQKFAEQRLKELSELDTKPNQKELDKIKSDISVIQAFIKQVDNDSNLSKDDKTKIISSCMTKLIQISTQYEKNLKLSQKIDSHYDDEIKVFREENYKNTQLKTHYTKGITTFNQRITYAKEQITKHHEEEEKNRNKQQEDFEKSLVDIQEKLKAQEEEGEDVRKQNVELKAQLEEEQKKYKERDEEFKKEIQQDGDGKNDLLTKLKDLEVQAKEAFKLKEEQAQLQKAQSEKKLKVLLYTQKLDEYISCLDKTQQMLFTFKEQLLIQSIKQEKLEKENEKIKQTTEKADKSMISIVQKNMALNQDIQGIEQQKSQFKKDIVSLQEKIKACN